jgi:hypothetical protein
MNRALSDRAFTLLALGEAVVVIAGQITLSAALASQIFILVLLFRNAGIASGRAACWFLVTAVLPISAFACLLEVFPHVLIPLIIFASIAGFGLFWLLITEYRLRRSFRGDAQ